MRIEQLLTDGAERFGAKVAIVAGRKHHSYRDLNTKSARLAAALAGRGVKRGDRMAVFMDNTCEAVVSTFAILRSGAVVCPVDPAVTPDTLADLLIRERAVGIFTEARLASAAAAAVARAPSVRVVVLAGGDRAPAHAGCFNFEAEVGGIGPVVGQSATGEPGDAAIVLNAVGLDGHDEIQILTHEDLVAAAGQSATPADAVVLASLPISSHYGLYQLLTALKAGATQVLECTSAFRETVFNRTDALQADARLAFG